MTSQPCTVSTFNLSETFDRTTDKCSHVFVCDNDDVDEFYTTEQGQSYNCYYCGLNYFPYKIKKYRYWDEEILPELREYQKDKKKQFLKDLEKEKHAFVQDHKEQNAQRTWADVLKSSKNMEVFKKLQDQKMIAFQEEQENELNDEYCNVVHVHAYQKKDNDTYQCVLCSENCKIADSKKLTH